MNWSKQIVWRELNRTVCLALEHLKEIFSRLRYPDDLVQSTIRRFVESKVSEDSHTRMADKREAPVRIVLPYKDQKSANVVRKQLADLSRKINVDISPVYTSKKIKNEIRVREDKPPLVSQQCVVYSFQCGLCDAGYVGYTCRLCRLHVPTLTPTNWRTQRIGNRTPPQRAARHGARRHHTEFSNLKEVSEQIWLSCFWNVFYQRTETNAKQTVRFNSRQTICLEQFVPRLFHSFIPLFFYSLPLYIVYTFSHILAFATFYRLQLASTYLCWFGKLTHLKMTSERSKRRDFLALAFISKSFSVYFKRNVFGGTYVQLWVFGESLSCSQYITGSSSLISKAGLFWQKTKQTTIAIYYCLLFKAGHTSAGTNISIW